MYLNENVPGSSEANANQQNRNIQKADPGARNVTMNVYAYNYKDSICQCSVASHFYSGKKDWAVNIWFFCLEHSLVAIHLSVMGVYTFNDVIICTIDLPTEKSNVETICKNTAQDVREFTNGYAFSVITTSSMRYPLFVISFTDVCTGWVDSKPDGLFDVNVSFIAFDLGKGHHFVEIGYSTPGLFRACTLCINALLWLLIYLGNARLRLRL